MGYRGIQQQTTSTCEMKTRWLRTDVNPKSMTKTLTYAPKRAVLEAGVNRNHDGGNKEISKKRNFFRTNEPPKWTHILLSICLEFRLAFLIYSQWNGSHLSGHKITCFWFRSKFPSVKFWTWDTLMPASYGELIQTLAVVSSVSNLGPALYHLFNTYSDLFLLINPLLGYLARSSLCCLQPENNS